MKWLGKKILPFFPIRVFFSEPFHVPVPLENRMRFSGGTGSGKKSCLSFRFLWNRKNGRPLRFACFSPTHEMGREKKLKARPRESIHEIRAAGRESEGTRNRRRPVFSYSDISLDSEGVREKSVLFPGPFFPTPGPLRFQRNLRGRPFFRFRRNRKERQDFIPSAPAGQRNKKRESEKKDQEKGPSSAVENRLRFSTADEGPPKIHRIFGGQRKKRKRGSPQHVISWGEAERPNSKNLDVRLLYSNRPPRESIHEWIRGGVPSEN